MLFRYRLYADLLCFWLKPLQMLVPQRWGWYLTFGSLEGTLKKRPFSSFLVTHGRFPNADGLVPPVCWFCKKR